MKPIQLVLIAVALLAALGAGFLMMNMNEKPARQNLLNEENKKALRKPNNQIKQT